MIVTTIITLSPLKDKDASDHIVYLHPVYRTFVYLTLIQLQDTSALRDEINFRQFQTNAFSQHKKKKDKSHNLSYKELKNIPNKQNKN